MGNGCIDPHFLDLSTSWRLVASFTPCHFTPGERDPGTHWTGCWMDPRAGLDEVEKRKFLTLPGLELRTLCPLARIQSLYRLRYPGYQKNVDIKITPELFKALILVDPFIYRIYIFCLNPTEMRYT
jgi:hypothetical protein